QHDVAEIGEEALGIRRSDQQRELLGRRQKYVRRGEFLALTLVRRRIAGTRLHGDGQAHLFDRLAQIALDIDCESLQRRNIEGVHALSRHARLSPWPAGEIDERGEKSGKRLACSGRRDEKDGFTGARAGEKLELMRPRRPASVAEPVQERFGQEPYGLAGKRDRLLAQGRLELNQNASRAKRLVSG